MEPVTLALIAVAVLALGVWSHGGYETCVAGGPDTVVEGPAAWFSPLGLVGILVAVGAVVMFTTG